MRDWSPEQLAEAAGVHLARPATLVPEGAPGPERVTIDSRDVRPGDLFVGLRGANVDGGRFAAAALAAGAWGVLVAPEYARDDAREQPGVLLTTEDPLAGLQALARSWRRALGAQVIAITGSTGKTSTKDLLRAMLAQGRRVAATEQNLNTEIGLPLTVLAAPAGTEVLVLEMAMRGTGQIAELAAIAEPDVGVIVNIGPVHLELLGSLEAIAAAKAELLADLHPGATAVLPANEPLLAAHLREDLHTVTFGPGGDVAEIPPALVLPFSSAHMRSNALAALAAARAVGVEPRGRLDVRLSALRGQRIELPGPVLVIDDCYNANPMSMRAALDDLAASAPGRRVAVLGDMLELGPDAARFHEEIGAHAGAGGVDVLVTVGPLAAGMAAGYARRRRRAPRRRRRGGGRRARRRARGARRHRAREGLARRRPRGRRAAPAQRGGGLAAVGEVLIAGTAALLICIFLSPKFIAFLQQREFGQFIREEGPAKHHVKAGTPTMGGIIIVFSIAIPFLILSEYDWRSVGVFGALVGCALLGFADDYTKIVRRRSLGLSARMKLGITIVISVGLWWIASEQAGLPQTLRLRVVDYQIDLSFLAGLPFLAMIYIVVAGTTSAVNLTDGLDGLAAGCAAIVALAYIGITFITTGQQDLAILSACVVGACVGFLWFNAFPATIFMGDTGSLALGGAIAGMAIMTKTEILLILLGGIFVVEALSVMIQVFSFQTFRKRPFLMAPIHHHFELLGWSETKIILRFWIIAAICSAIGFTLYQASIA